MPKNEEYTSLTDYKASKREMIVLVCFCTNTFIRAVQKSLEYFASLPVTVYSWRKA